MKNTLVVMSSNRELEKQTKATLQNLSNLGAMLLMERGSADVAFARCRALSWACEKLREHPERDVVLMIDDDSAVAGASESAVPRQPSDAPTARGPSRGPDGRRLKN